MRQNLLIPNPENALYTGRAKRAGGTTSYEGIACNINRKISILMALLFLMAGPAFSQRYMEDLSRGVVAVRTSSSEVFVSWRMLGTDPSDVGFNLYRGTTLLNSTPITGSTNFVDNTSTDGSYTVRPVVNGTEGTASAPATVWAEQYKTIPLQVPAGGTTPDGVNYTYSPNDASVGDVDGDGEYEIILKWDPSNSKDNSQSGYTGNVYLDAYKMDGTHMWRIDLGRNIRAGAHYTQFIVYDLDSDGKAEVACKTADATIDGLGQVIGDANADYRNSGGYILEGPEFLTVFNGETGAAMATTNYLPARGNVCDWGDCYGNRVDRFLAGVGYFDGQRPSLLMTRGYYTRSVLAAWDWRDGALTQRWIFDTNDAGNESYAGQGYHSLSINDVDGDGKDEVVFGSMVVDDNGIGLYNTGLGHGDAQHVSDLLPDRPGLESWTCHEDASKYDGNGLWLRDAGTGERLWGVPATGDVGRALSADIDPNYPGNEMWGSVGNLYTSGGQTISTTKPSMNFAIWWDGDLSREILDGDIMDKWNPDTKSVERLFTVYNTGAQDINGSKANPNLTADLLGDWREEMVFRHWDNTKLLVITTTIPTQNRFYTLMHDSQYRTSVSWQNAGYNQPPHTSFFLGNGMTGQPAANILLASNDRTKNPNLSLTASAGDAEVSLSWTVSDISVSSQEVYRDLDSDPAGRTRIATLSGTDRTFVDNTVTNGATYYYWVAATDADGTVTNSNSANATPQAVVEVVLTADGGNGEVSLGWTVSNISLQGQEVYRDTDSDPAGRVRIATLSTTERAYTDNTVTNGTTYYYWIKATDINGVVTNSNAASATPSTSFAGTYVLTNRSSGKVVDVDGASLANGANVLQNAASGNESQKWMIKSLDNGYYIIINANSGKAMDVEAVSTASGANILQWDSTASNNQQWSIIDHGTGYYSFIARHSGHAMEVTKKGSRNDGANIQQGTYSSSEARQQFSLKATTSSTMDKGTKEILLLQHSNTEAIVYPNPSSSSFTIEAAGPFEYTILDGLGRVVEKGSGNGSTQTGNSLSQGLYIITINAEGKIQQLKLIKK